MGEQNEGRSMYLSVEQVQEIHQLALASGLQERRNELLYGVDAPYAAALPDRGDKSRQTLSDLQTMNIGGEVGRKGLVRWLRNAAYDVKVKWPERASFFTERALMVERAAPILAAQVQQQHPPKVASRVTTQLMQALVEVVALCLTVDDLIAVLRRCFGDTPVRAGAVDGALDVREVAAQSLALAERENLTVVFLAFALESPRCSAALRQLGTQTFPELASAAASFANIVYDATTKLAKHAPAITSLLGANSPLPEIRKMIADLQCYKALHEAVHQVKNQPQPRAPDDGDAAAVRKFFLAARQYVALVRTARARSAAALAVLPATSTALSEKPWINLLDHYAAQIEAMVVHADVTVAEMALDAAASAIAPRLDEFNLRMVELARQMLDGPLNAMREQMLADATLAPAIQAIDVLRLALRLRVVEHTRWQETDNSLFQLGEALRSGPDAAFSRFERQWRVVRRKIPALGNANGGGDKAMLEALAMVIDIALINGAVDAGGPPFGEIMEAPYDEFRSETQQQFLIIDASFKQNCAELASVTGSLP